MTTMDLLMIPGLDNSRALKKQREKLETQISKAFYQPKKLVRKAFKQAQ